MTNSPWWRPTLALTLALCSLPTLAAAQDGQRQPSRGQPAPPQPITFSFVLRQAGDDLLNPFGISGRREVLQLRARHSPLRGEFRRSRLDRLGQDDWTTAGWYEIRGNTIQLYHSDASGNATGRVEIGRYLEETICFNDPESGQLLAFSYIKPRNATAASDGAGQVSESTEAEITDDPAEDSAPLDRCGGERISAQR